MMTLIEAILLGVLQGVTEFLPVSSSGHLVLAEHLLPGFHQPGILFEILLHLGTMLAVIIYFWQDLKALASSLWRRGQRAKVDRRILILVGIGSVPTAIIGHQFLRVFKKAFNEPVLVCLMLFVTGILLALAERYRSGNRRQTQLNWADALIAGTIQGLAIMPGISRSGSTIAALLFRGVEGETAARFSFLLALPAISGAAMLSFQDLKAIRIDQLPVYLAGSGVSLVVGLLCIHLLMGVVRKRRLALFAIYCWLAGSLGVAYFL
jgi:undecaprenyl-diphosphatase